MIRPAQFGFNPETADSNVFQQMNSQSVLAEALDEFDSMVAVLQSEGVTVWVEQDMPEPAKPDAIFPNNWLGIHPGKRMVLYPMLAPNRRLERDPALIARIQQRLPQHQLHDIHAWEEVTEYVEGTGSLVFDHLQQLVFACHSPRTHAKAVQAVADLLGYEAHLFDAIDEKGKPYYHSNVVLSIGTQFAIVCAECIADNQREALLNALTANGRQLLFITRAQVNAFAGNVLELRNAADEYLIVLSQQAMDALEANEIAFLQQFGLLLPIEISSIERTGGGSVRCMMAEVFL
jgi:hypothetical protein